MFFGGPPQAWADRPFPVNYKEDTHDEVGHLRLRVVAADEHGVHGLGELGSTIR